MSRKMKTHASEKHSAIRRATEPTAQPARELAPQARSASAHTQALNAPLQALAPGDILALQSAAGNEVVQRVLAHALGQAERPIQAKENRTGLPDNLKAGVENLSGLSLDDVKVHYNSAKPAELGALAYTQGQEIHVSPGQEKHLPHEAWHAAQQKQGRVKPILQAKGVAVNDDAGLETEASVMGDKALQAHALSNAKTAA